MNLSGIVIITHSSLAKPRLLLHFHYSHFKYQRLRNKPLQSQIDLSPRRWHSSDACGRRFYEYLHAAHVINFNSAITLLSLVNLLSDCEILIKMSHILVPCLRILVCVYLHEFFDARTFLLVDCLLYMKSDKTKDAPSKLIKWKSVGIQDNFSSNSFQTRWDFGMSKSGSGK